MSNTAHNLLSYLRVAVGAWRDDPRDDAALLGWFAESGDEAAFRALVWRHGALVWQTCRRILGDTPDAEDAFQAAFLALARKAGRLRREPLAGWLHRVARQAALDVQISVQRRRSLEQRLGTVKQPESERTDADRAELYAALNDELAGLPEKLRVPLLLRYLEEKSQDEVARLLGCTRGMVRRRLARGEAMLRQRLDRRGLAVGMGSMAALLGDLGDASAVPARLIGSTARAAVAFRGGNLTGVGAEAARAVSGAFPTSMGTTIMRKSLWIVLACFCSLGIGLAAWQAPAARPDAAGSPESAASPKASTESGSRQVDHFGDPLPQGALARLGTVRLRHVGGFNLNGWTGSVVFSRDGKELITSSPNNPIRLWDTATGKLLRSFDDSRRDWEVPFCLSPDGKILAIGGSGKRDSPRADIREVASLREVATGKLLQRFQLPDWEGGICPLAFSQDSRMLISFDCFHDSFHIRVWETATRKKVRDQPLMIAEKNYRLAVNKLFSSPDAKILALIHKVKDNNDICLWETATGKELCHLPLGRGEIVRCAVAISPDNRFLAVTRQNVVKLESGVRTSDEAVHLLEVATGKELRKWTPNKTGIYSVAFSPDGKILATGSFFGPIRLWETATGMELRQCQGFRGHVVALAFSPDGSTLASLAGLHDHSVRLWEVASGKERLLPSRGHVGPVVSLAFAADGKSVISGGRDGLVSLWDAETGQEQRPHLRAGDFQALAILSPDGKTILSVGNSVGNSFSTTTANLLEFFPKIPTVVCVWDRITGQKLRQFEGPPAGFPQSLALSPDGKILVLNSWRSVRLIEVSTGKVMRQFSDLEHAVLSPDGKTMVAIRHANNDTALSVDFFATATGENLGSIKAPGQWYCLAFSPDGQILAVGGVDRLPNGREKDTIRLWHVQRSKKDWKEAEKLVGHQGAIWALSFSPDGKTLASAGLDGTLRLWEVATGKERRRFAGHSGEVWCLAFAPDGRRLAAGGNDATTLVWDVTGRLQNGQLQPVKLSSQEVKCLWTDLASADAARAGQAVWTLAAAPAQALPLLREYLRPVTPAGTRIVRLIADLDSDTFAVRQKAADELARLGEDAEPALRQALAKSASLDTRRRLEQLLEPLEEKFSLSGERLRSLRALEVLGQIGTPAALALLEELAHGAPEARRTLEAQAILKRLRTRLNPTKP